MHIPDFMMLDVRVAALAGGLAAAGVGAALVHARRNLPRKRVPLMGLASAFIFAAQMLNFPVAGGTSGHLMGGVLAAVLLGPAAAVIVMTAVLILQCLVFTDGGVLALGANVLNMAVVAPIAGYLIYAGVRQLIGGQRGVILGAAFAGWCSTVLAAACCAGQLTAAGFAPGWLVLPAMVHIHMLIGIGEAIITALVVASVSRTRPDLLPALSAAPRPAEGRAARLLPVIALGLVASLGLAIFASPFASSHPDGLERVAEDLQLAREDKPLLKGLLPDYQVPGISREGLGTAIAGGIGTVLAFGLSLGLAIALAPRARKAAA